MCYCHTWYKQRACADMTCGRHRTDAELRHDGAILTSSREFMISLSLSLSLSSDVCSMSARLHVILARSALSWRPSSDTLQGGVSREPVWGHNRIQQVLEHDPTTTRPLMITCVNRCVQHYIGRLWAPHYGDPYLQLIMRRISLVCLYY